MVYSLSPDSLKMHIKEGNESTSLTAFLRTYFLERSRNRANASITS